MPEPAPDTPSDASAPNLTLGIDTGGTYTDAVILDGDTGQLLSKGKALTTPADLCDGIQNAISRLRQSHAAQIRLAAISTTLATNAIVEGHGHRVGLLLIGYDQKLLQHNGLINRLPVAVVEHIQGGHDVKGNELRALDEEGLHRALGSMIGEVDAFAVAGYFSAMNPSHEVRARELISMRTGAPVVCASELSTKLNAMRRLSTAVLNARILPLIADLMRAVRAVLQAQGINAPLMIVKGDGSLINQRTAVERPIETILSGPVASAMGGHFLSGMDTAIVVDMGGTTTDIAVLENGRPWISPHGASIGGWQTHVEAADLRTIGLGGDSHIAVGGAGRLQIGPRRAVPLCRLGAEFPLVVRELEAARFDPNIQPDRFAGQFLMLVHKGTTAGLSEAELRILEILSDGPCAVSQLKHELDISLVHLGRMEAVGVLQRSGLTPTDLLPSAVEAIDGNAEAAAAGAELVAKQLGIPPQTLVDLVISQMVDRIALELLDKLVSDRSGHSLTPAPFGWRYLFNQFLNGSPSEMIGGSLRIGLPIVGIGAPVSAFLPQVARKLGSRCIIPDHAEVGNAIGAVVAGVTRTVEILVQPQIKGAGTVRFLVHSPGGREEVNSLSEGVIRAREIASEIARRSVYLAGAKDVVLEVDERRVNMGHLSEVTVRARASGRPRGADG